MKSHSLRSGLEESHERSILQIDRLIVVAGPTSVGKSSFIRQLRTGKLPQAIQSRFPSDLREWELTEPKYLASLLARHAKRSGAEGRIPALIYHYDTMRIFNQGFGRFTADPGLDILYSAQSILIADLRAPAETLEQHWLGRLERLPRFPLAKRTLKRIKRLLLGRTKTNSLPRAEGFSILEAYRQPGWVDGLNSNWDRFLDELAARHERVELVGLQSVPRPGAEPSFVLRV